MLLPVAYPIQTPRRYFTDKDGKPLISGKIKTFRAGSESEFAQTYRDAYRNASNQKIVKLDNAGSAFIYLFNAQRLEVYDKNDNFVERKFLPQTEYYTLFYDRYGKPLSHGKVYTYDIASTIKKPSYQDAGQIIPNPNPIVLDESGGATICIAGSYRLRSYDVKGVFITDQDYKQENRFVLTSKVYPLHCVESVSTQLTMGCVFNRTILNQSSLNENLTTGLSIRSAVIYDTYNAYSINPDKLITNFSLHDAVQRDVMSRVKIKPESISTRLSLSQASIKNVLITWVMSTERISTTFALEGAQITN